MVALGIDQIKSIPVQAIVWFTVIRRCGKYDPGEFEEWDDDEMILGGVETSLWQTMRNSVSSFLDLDFIYNLIIGMTIFLCVVIFLELSFPDALNDSVTGEKTKLGQAFFVVNYVLLVFFMIEISLKLFANFAEFLSEFINVFDSVIVIISFVFMVTENTFKAIGVLRMLRLIKVLMLFRKDSLAKKAL